MSEQKYTQVTEVVNPELPVPDGTVISIEYEQVTKTSQFENFRLRIGLQVPTQRKLIKKAIERGWNLIKEEHDRIARERYEELTNTIIK